MRKDEEDRLNAWKDNESQQCMIEQNEMREDTTQKWCGEEEDIVEGTDYCLHSSGKIV